MCDITGSAGWFVLWTGKLAIAVLYVVLKLVFTHFEATGV